MNCSNVTGFFTFRKYYKAKANCFIKVIQAVEKYLHLRWNYWKLIYSKNILIRFKCLHQSNILGIKL